MALKLWTFFFGQDGSFGWLLKKSCPISKTILSLTWMDCDFFLSLSIYLSISNYICFIFLWYKPCFIMTLPFVGVDWWKGGDGTAINWPVHALKKICINWPVGVTILYKEYKGADLIKWWQGQDKVSTNDISTGYFVSLFCLSITIAVRSSDPEVLKKKTVQIRMHATFYLHQDAWYVKE